MVARDPFADDFLEQIKLRPGFCSAERPWQVFYLYFDLNATMADVADTLKRIEGNFEMDNEVSANVYLLEYIMKYGSDIRVRPDATYAHPPNMEAFLNRATAPFPLRTLPSASMYLNPADFKHELRDRLAAIGLSRDISIYDQNMEPLSSNALHVSQWLSSTGSKFLILAPAPIATPTPTVSDDGSAARRRQQMTITLKPGIQLTLSDDHFTLTERGMVPSAEVIEAVEEFVELYKKVLEASRSSSAASQADESLYFAELGRKLRPMLSESKLIKNTDMLTDVQVGQRASHVLNSGETDDTIVLYRMANDFIKLQRRMNELEAQTRDAANQRFSVILKNQLSALGSRIANIAVAIYRFELTSMLIYCFVGMLVIDFIEPGRLRLQTPILLLLFVNLVLFFLKSFHHLDVHHTLVNNWLPQVFPATLPESGLLHQMIEDAVARETSEGESSSFDYNKALDRLIQRPPMYAVLAALILTVMPSALRDWKGKVRQRRTKLKEQLQARVKTEVLKLEKTEAEAAQTAHSTAIAPHAAEPLHRPAVAFDAHTASNVEHDLNAEHDDL